MQEERTYKHYIVYEVTNKLNGKTYIGIHRTNNINDGYLGSGTGIQASVRLHGKENFSRRILYDFDNEFEMLDKEAELVDEEYVKNPETYNQTKGGRGGFSHIDLRGENNPMKNPDVANKVSMRLKGRLFSDEHRINLSKSHTGEKHHLFGKKRSQEIKNKIAASHTGQKRSEAAKAAMSLAWKHRLPDSEETRKRKSEAAKLREQRKRETKLLS